MRSLTRILCGVVAAAWTAGAGGHELDAAARAFLDGLSEAHRVAASWPFQDEERADIHYAPIGLDGLRHGELDAEAYERGDALLAATLSGPGLERVRQVRDLEAVVNAQGNFAMRLVGFYDPGRYFWAFFGEPGAAEPWGYRYEGHHLSLNVTVTADGVATTPLFIGAQPREVPAGFDVGPPAGTMVLGEEERLARRLYDTLDAAQRRAATLEYEADRGLMIGQVPRVPAPDAVGAARGDMSPAQRELLDALLDGLAGLWTEEIATARRADIAAARADLRFAFVAADDPPDSFYVRIAGPALLVEIDNTEGGDHVHAVWHQGGGDFGDDLLARHLAADHGIRLTRR